MCIILWKNGGRYDEDAVPEGILTTTEEEGRTVHTFRHGNMLTMHYFVLKYLRFTVFLY